MADSKRPGKAQPQYLKQFEGAGYRVRLLADVEQTLEVITSTNRLLAEQLERRMGELKTFPPPNAFWSEPKVTLAGEVVFVVVVKLDNMNVEMTAHYKLGFAGERLCDVVHLHIPLR